MTNVYINNSLLNKLHSLYQRMEALRLEGKIGLAEAIMKHCLEQLENVKRYITENPKITNEDFNEGLFKWLMERLLYRQSMFKSVKRDIGCKSAYSNKAIRIEVDYDNNEFERIINSKLLYSAHMYPNDPIRDILHKAFPFDAKKIKIIELLKIEEEYLSIYEPFGLILYKFLNKELSETLNLIRNTKGSSSRKTLYPKDVYSKEGLMNLYFNLLKILNIEICANDIYLFKDFFIRKQTPLLFEFHVEALQDIEDILNQLVNNPSSSLYDYLKLNSESADLASVFGNNLLQLIPVTSDLPILKSDYLFFYLNEASAWINRLVPLFDELENNIRLKHGLKRIGEGSFSEALMIDYLKNEFEGLEILTQASPIWLGRLRYDAFLPSLNLAIEYQGEQHFQAIEFYGGQEKFQEQQLRDKKKKELSEKNGIRIEYITFEENILNRIIEIKNKYFGS